jgi:N-acetyl-gamma-glutamylphosphate reductase
VVAPCGDGTLLAAAFDNLRKGSAGAAAHNLRLMLS